MEKQKNESEAEATSAVNALVKLSWIMKRRPSGTIWQLFDGSMVTSFFIFKHYTGYVLGQDEYPTFKTLKKAKNEGIRRYKKDCS